MPPLDRSTHEGLTAELHGAHAEVTASQRRLLEIVAECERAEIWKDDGCRDLAQWLSAHLGVSNWAARRWITAASALPRLPLIRAALDSGRLSLDKALDLCRFATPETEKKLIAWARRVTVAGVRRKADVAARPAQEDVVEADKSRYLDYWWCIDGGGLGLEGYLPADQGAVVARALDRMAARVPDIVEDGDDHPGPEESLETRRADALVAMASREIADDQDADRATVVVHAELAALCGDDGGCEIENGPVIHPETARRLACDARLQTVLHDGAGNAVGIGSTARTASPSLLRQLRYRDRGCTFPGCDSRRWLHAHHIVHWIRGGPTEPDNMVLVCTFHHKLVHEHGWQVRLGAFGRAKWFRPSGRRFLPGPAPPPEHARS